MNTVNVNGKEALLLVPETSDQLAIVDFKTLQKLASLLPAANFWQIKQDFIYQLDRTQTLEDFVATMKEEVNFHETINLITSITLKEAAVATEELIS